MWIAVTVMALMLQTGSPCGNAGLETRASWIRQSNLPHSLKGALLVSFVKGGMGEAELHLIFGREARQFGMGHGPGLMGTIVYPEYGVRIGLGVAGTVEIAEYRPQ